MLFDLNRLLSLSEDVTMIDWRWDVFGDKIGLMSEMCVHLKVNEAENWLSFNTNEFLMTWTFPLWTFVIKKYHQPFKRLKRNLFLYFYQTCFLNFSMLKIFESSVWFWPSFQSSFSQTTSTFSELLISQIGKVVDSLREADFSFVELFVVSVDVCNASWENRKACRVFFGRVISFKLSLFNKFKFKKEFCNINKNLLCNLTIVVLKFVHKPQPLRQETKSPKSLSYYFYLLTKLLNVKRLLT